MSKASEYAAKVQAAKEQPQFIAPTNSSLGGTETVAYVGDLGWLQLNAGALKGDNILALADWIYATFGETPKPEGKDEGSDDATDSK
jgi:hypothetical protein